MKLIKLVIENFKGISKLELSPKGKNINIYGDNATGKTTVVDAFMWLLFDKDSGDRKTFHIKPLDSTGKVLSHGVESTVTAIVEHEGEVTEYKKVYKEKWSKKRGSINAVFDGHDTKYYIDGLSVKKNIYERSIEELCNKEVFKMVTNPLYFSQIIKWEERRKLLFEICGGDLEEEKVINEKEEFYPLLEKGKHSVSDYRKICVSKRSELNKQLIELPLRISERNMELTECNIDINVEKSEIKSLQDKKLFIESNLNQIINNQHTNHLKNQIDKITNYINKLENDNNIFKQQVITEFNNNQYNLLYKDREELNNYINMKSNISFEIKNIELTIRNLTMEREKLLGEYKILESSKWCGDEVCPTCNQGIPIENIEKAKEEFNNNKSLKISENITKGKKVSEELSILKETLNKKQKELEDIENTINTLNLKIKESNNICINPENMPGYIDKKAELTKQIKELNTDLENSIGNSKELEANYLEEIRLLQEIISEHERNIIKANQLDSTKKRISELEQERLTVANELEKLDGIIYLCDEFTKHKVSLIEEKINSKFKIAKFKLFDTQINGGVNEVCEVTYKGVPFTTNLNNASKINVGIDIINTLAEHYKFVAPIFIDNAESVTKLIETNAQVIRLVVSEVDKKLTVNIA